MIPVTINREVTVWVTSHQEILMDPELAKVIITGLIVGGVIVAPMIWKWAFSE